MSLLVGDTETTGLPDFKKQATDPCQPHIVSLAAKLFDDKRDVVAEINFIIKPEGYVIPKEMSDIHGITQEKAEKYGIKMGTALKLYLLMCDKAELLVFHNYPFDEKMIRRDLHHCGMIAEAEAYRARKNFCTMKATTNIVRIPGRAGFKWPKLIEAHQHFFGCGFDDAHTAMADVNACARVYFEGLFPLSTTPTNELPLAPVPTAETMEID